jgi:hypothetical protein
LIIRTLSRIACGPLLAVLLAVAQIGAFTHEVGHVADDLAQPRKHGNNDKHAPQGKVCEQCIAFGQIGGAIGNPLAALNIAASSQPAAPTSAFQFIVVAAPAPRSRGPPSIL